VVNAKAVARTHTGSVLLGQPETENSKIAAKEAEEEKHHVERMQSLRHIERPTKAKHDANQHPKKIEGQRSLAPDPFRE